MRRALAIVLVAAVVALGSGACGNKEELRDEVLAALRRTEASSYKFVYVDERPDATFPGSPPSPPNLTVQGLVEDDFRFKARVAVDGNPSFDEVVDDDLLAMRFLDPSRVATLVNTGKLTEADTATDLQGVDSLAALQSRRWVIDETAAPSVTVGRVREASLGQDPVLDAITAFTYVETAIRESFAVEEFSVDDVAPAYSDSEDDFPKPEKGSGVTRYDLRRPKLPPPGQQAGLSSNGRPQTRHFRRMAIYVKGGRVIEVREAVDVKGRFLKDVIKYAKTYAKVSGANAQEISQFEDQVRSAPVDVQGDLVLQGLSLALSSSGDEPILQRRMRLQFADVGKPVVVDLPNEDVVKGGLGFLIVTAQGKVADEGDGSSTGGGSSPPTSAPPAATSETTTP